MPFIASSSTIEYDPRQFFRFRHFHMCVSRFLLYRGGKLVSRQGLAGQLGKQKLVL